MTTPLSRVCLYTFRLLY